LFTTLIGGVVEWVMLAHQTKRTWQDDLVARYPHLFNLTEHGRTFTPGYPTVGDGWRELIEMAVGRIADTLAAAPSSSVTVVQVKEKFGTLRLYWHGKDLSTVAEHAIEDAVAKAEARSACSCETCGEEGVLYRVGGQLVTACSEHAKGALVPVEPGWENLHLLRGYRDGKIEIIVCRRYDRASDTFVDVDPKSLGIEE
jgi:hypothetical protein